MSTLSMRVPSYSRHSDLRVVPASVDSWRTLGQQRRQECLAEPATNARGQLGHRRRIGLQPPEVLPRQLIGSKRRHSERDDRSPTLVAIEVSKVPGWRRAAGRVEHEGQAHGCSAGWAEPVRLSTFAARSAFCASISASSASVMAKPTNHEGSMVR